MVRSAYHAILDSNITHSYHHGQPSSGGDSPLVWKKLWKLRILHHNLVFLWRLITGSIPCAEFLQLRRLQDAGVCVFCGAPNTSASHIFFNCSFTRCIWNTAGLWDLISKFEQPSFLLWIRDIFLELKPDMCELIAVICDFIWFIRNKKKFDDVVLNPFSIVLSANNELLDFHRAQNWPKRPSPDFIPGCLIQKKPDGPSIFFDGSLSNSCADIGIVAFDNSGNFIIGFSKKFQGNFSAEIAECFALREALLLGQQLKLNLIEIFGDAAAIVLAINGEAQFPTSCQSIAEDIKRLKSLVSLQRSEIAFCNFHPILAKIIKRS
ncbi:hypothetical protein DH2020_019532 [Rehmannia glutinosa]|uniref:Uncharacterized protein n=1 Tax=Rehmannia glutinosa TaxID=99300 RepID=A0ABR0WRE0_REHGL